MEIRKISFTRIVSFAGTLVSLILLSACGPQRTSSFSILPTQNTFTQSQSSINNKVDILWIVDNSGSMQPLQTSLANNFSVFMNSLISKGFDFQIAVTTTDAYKALPNYQNNPNLSKFKDGRGSNHTGVFVITPATPNLLQTFITNASQGTSGSGDERAFQSMFASLDNSMNAGFLRQNAFFAPIILSDEDDFSDSTRAENNWNPYGQHSYSNPNLWSIQSILDGLDQRTNSNPSNRNYVVSSITIPDAACDVAYGGYGIIGVRHVQIAEATGGVVGSVCNQNFAAVLDNIQNRILELSTRFTLSQLPIPETIEVIVNGQTVPAGTQNGWTYEASSNSIYFHGTAIPAANSSILVKFDPLNLT